MSGIIMGIEPMNIPSGCALLLALAAGSAFAADAPPKSWVDPDTGHRVVRLTNEPGSASLYFNQNGYTADGKEMIYTTPEGISVLKLGTGETHSVVKGRARVIVTGHKTQSVYYLMGDEVFATDVDTLVTRKIAKLPPRGSIATVNADETLLAGTYIEGNGQDFAGRNPPPGQAAPATLAPKRAVSICCIARPPRRYRCRPRCRAARHW
jgi:oligogalacturonide lyase